MEDITVRKSENASPGVQNRNLFRFSRKEKTRAALFWRLRVTVAGDGFVMEG